VHVEDVAGAIARAMQSAPPGTCYELGGPRIYAYRSLLEMLARHYIIPLHERDLISRDGRLGQRLREIGEHAPETERHGNQKRLSAEMLRPSAPHVP
jgi:nucleoside-diphosphate-sugar epimerase